MKMRFSVGAKIQIAILGNVIFAVVFGAIIRMKVFGLTTNVSFIINLIVNMIVANLYGFFISRKMTKPLKER